MHRDKILAGYNLLEEHSLRKVGSATGKRYDRWSKSQVKLGKTRTHQGFPNSTSKPFYQSHGDFLTINFAQK